jgi:hypothetical protein
MESGNYQPTFTKSEIGLLVCGLRAIAEGLAYFIGATSEKSPKSSAKRYLLGSIETTFAFDKEKI